MCRSTTLHYFQNPEAFTARNSEKTANNAMWAQYLGTGIANISSMCSVWMAAPTTSTGSPTTAATTTPVEVEDPQGDPIKPEAESDDYIKTKITEYLKDSGIEPNDDMMKAIVQKYKNIKKFVSNNNLNLSENDLKKRIVRFANGLKYKIATDTNTNYEIPGVAKAMSDGDMDNYVSSMKNHAASVIELYDDNCDGKLNRREFFASQLESAGVEQDSLDTAGTEIIFSLLDIDNSGNLDADEISALQWAISKRLDGNTKRTGQDITPEEYQAVQQDIAAFVDVVLSANLNEEEDSVTNLLREGKTADALTLILNKTQASPEDKLKAETLINMYITGYRGLNNIKQ